MYMKTFKKIGTSLICALFATPMMAQQTYEEMEQLTVNEQVTTVITASEPIRFVDISTDMVVGDQPINNTIRLKPKEGAHADGEVLAIVPYPICPALYYKASGGCYRQANPARREDCL